MDLACRFSAAAQQEGLRLIALKGISIAQELYGGFENRPMADVDLLVVDTARFEAAAQVARAMGLVESGASDHALVFKEVGTGVVLELHIALTSCPGLFRVEPERLWARRKAVAGTALFRLADEDLLLHLALHTAFQHAFAANSYHYSDFTLALRRLNPPVDRLDGRAREWGATAALSAMAEAMVRRSSSAPALPAPFDVLRGSCPKGLARWIRGRSVFPPEANLIELAKVRSYLAPSPGLFLRKTLFPRAIPGQEARRVGPGDRLVSLFDAGLMSLLHDRRPSR